MLRLCTQRWHSHEFSSPVSHCTVLSLFKYRNHPAMQEKKHRHRTHCQPIFQVRIDIQKGRERKRETVGEREREGIGNLFSDKAHRPKQGLGDPLMEDVFAAAQEYNRKLESPGPAVALKSSDSDVYILLLHFLFFLSLS